MRKEVRDEPEIYWPEENQPPALGSFRCRGCLVVKKETAAVLIGIHKYCNGCARGEKKYNKFHEEFFDVIGRGLTEDLKRMAADFFDNFKNSQRGKFAIEAGEYGYQAINRLFESDRKGRFREWC